MRPLLFGLLTLAVAAGCGDDPISLSEYVDRADGICRDVEKETLAAKSEKELLDVQRSALERLEKLPTPDERRQDVEEFERSMRELVDSWEDASAAATLGNDQAEEQAQERNLALGDKTVDAAKDLGLRVCAQGSA